MEKHNPKAPEDVTFIREKTYTLPITLARGLRIPTGSAKSAFLPAILGDVNNAGGGGAPIERENEGGMDHFMAIENKEKKRQRKRKIQISRK